jgi:class 3 adenylate cyclase
MARRLAAILAADVVGYSRMMAVDEAGTHARLKALRQDFIEPTIAEHHGRVVKLMGDGALVEFASVVDAIECAAAIQEGVAERQAELPEDGRIASPRAAVITGIASCRSAADPCYFAT